MRSLADYLAFPYASKGRCASEGVDCWGLVRIFYAEQFGIELPAHDERYLHSDSRGEVAALAADEIAIRWRRISAPQYGDVVTLTLAARPFHVGVVLNEGRFLHALDSRVNTVIDRLDGPMWGRRIEGFYRHAERS